MFVSEDGYVTGSIDVSKLDEIEPKSDEAKAQHAALKAERDAGQKQAAADAERVAEVSRRQNPQLRTDEERAEAEKAGLESSQRQQREAERQAAEQQKAEQQRQTEQANAAKASSRKQG
jgi:hypothetical protein